MGKDEGTPNPHAGDHILEVGGHADTDLLCFLALEGVYQLGLLHDIVDTVRYSGIIGIHGSALFIGCNCNQSFGKILMFFMLLNVFMHSGVQM